MLLANGYTRFKAQGFDRERALFPVETLVFLEDTQPKFWDNLEAMRA